MTAPMTAKIVHVTINRPWKAVYEFASDHAKMPSWAAGLASGLTPQGDDWVASGPLGDVTVSFAKPNEYGVIDHIVTMPDGLQVYNALRVTPNGDGSEISFTVLQLPGMSDDDLKNDAELVYKDLKTLKKLLETT
ncbi:SRPBCC family protein [Agrobacterium sp.]|uniref:SRPBCC family protein n=1 Tax=Agrobacterium sp. TaxID=361 RepID=UPI0028B24659|nr:SRPBCC family protein [Agrobacterium sp.]